MCSQKLKEILNSIEVFWKQTTNKTITKFESVEDEDGSEIKLILLYKRQTTNKHQKL